jgi:hypothetical protein
MPIWKHMSNRSFAARSLAHSPYSPYPYSNSNFNWTKLMVDGSMWHVSRCTSGILFMSTITHQNADWYSGVAVHKVTDFIFYASVICVTQLEGNICFIFKYISIHAGNFLMFCKMLHVLGTISYGWRRSSRRHLLKLCCWWLRVGGNLFVN